MNKPNARADVRMCEQRHDIEAERNERYLSLLRTFRRHIEHYCIVHSNCREDAEDMMQEVFIAVWENIDALRSDSTPQQVNRWLQKVMRTVFVRQIRRPSIKAEAQLGEAANVADTADSDRELIEELVSHLPPDDRQILQERFYGYSNAEIAVRMGMKENTLNKRMSRIVTKLKEIYKEIYENKQY